jgi:predicted Ser/Thr protein kinase
MSSYNQVRVAVDPAWTFLAEGGDGTVYRSSEHVLKVFRSPKKAAKEAKYLQRLSTSGFTPVYISYDNDRSVIMQYLHGVTLHKYLRLLREMGAQAPADLEKSMVNMYYCLRDLHINPNDSNLLNYVVNPESNRIYRIDFTRSIDNDRVLHYCQLLMQKVYRYFPLATLTLKPYLLPYITEAWKQEFGF